MVTLVDFWGYVFMASADPRIQKLWKKHLRARKDCGADQLKFEGQPVNFELFVMAIIHHHSFTEYFTTEQLLPVINANLKAVGANAVSAKKLSQVLDMLSGAGFLCCETAQWVISKEYFDSYLKRDWVTVPSVLHPGIKFPISHETLDPHPDVLGNIGR